MGIACRHAAACGRLRSVSDENFDVVDEHRDFGEERERREIACRHAGRLRPPEERGRRKLRRCRRAQGLRRGT